MKGLVKKYYKKILIVIIGILCIMASPLSTVRAAEEEIGRNKAEAFGGTFGEIVTMELKDYDDEKDVGVYTIRYKLYHSGESYTYQNVPVALYVDGVHITTFEEWLGKDWLFSNDTQTFGTVEISMKAGENHHIRLEDTYEGGVTQVSIDKDIYVKFPKYTVTYQDYNGSELKTESVEKYSNATAPSNPTRTGYTFTGWSSDGTSIKANTTITARYTINYYPVRYLDHNGTILKNQSVAYGNNATAPANPSRTGYTFTGWSNNGANITAARDITAQYSINYYPITFNSNGGSVVGAQSIAYGNKVSKPTNPSKANYKFMGWYQDSALTQVYDFNSNIGASGFTLYAKWDKHPTITAGDKTFYQGEYTHDEWVDNIRMKSVSASDIEDGNITSKIKVVSDNVNVDVNGIYKATYQITDTAGTIITKDIKVTVKFNNPPVITGKDKVFFENQYSEEQWLDTHRWTDMDAKDTEDGNLKSKVRIVYDSTKIKTPGTYKVTYSVTDAFGKTSTKDISVTVKFNTPPSITAPKRDFFENEYTVDEWKKSLLMKNITASDVEDGTLTDKIQVIKDNVDPSTPGKYDVLYRVTDSLGKTTDKVGKVEVKFNNLPVVTASSRKYIENEYTLEDWKEDLMMKDVTASDIEDGDLTENIEVVSDNVDPTIPGYYNTTFKVTDSFGKSTNRMIETEIVFNNVPIISAENKTFHEGEYDDWLDEIMKDVSASDIEDGDITDDIKITSNNVDPDVPGSYEVGFEVTDSLSKTTSKTIDVTVLENQAPTLQIIAENRRIIEGEYTIDEWQSLRLNNVKAFDFEDKDITERIEVITDKVNPGEPGTYEVTYKVTDDFGKSAEKTIKVTVEPNQAPVLHVSERWFYTTDDVNAKALLSKVMAYDDFDGTLTSSVQLVSTTVENGVVGDYEAVYSISDSYGKTTTATAIIHIVDRGGNPVNPIPPTPPVVDDDSIYHWNGKQAAGIDIVKILENADIHEDAYLDVVFGIYSADDIVYGGKVVLEKDSLVDIVEIDDKGHGEGKVMQAGKYYVKEIATDDQYVLNNKVFHFTFNYSLEK